jgi:hypothetical protein
LQFLCTRGRARVWWHFFSWIVIFTCCPGPKDLFLFAVMIFMISLFNSEYWMIGITGISEPSRSSSWPGDPPFL